MLLYFRLKNYGSSFCFRLLISRLLRSYGRGSRVVAPRGIEGIQNIAIGDNVYIASDAVLAAVPHTGSACCELKIGSGTSLGYANHIYATRSVRIGANVITANNVYISDNAHGYQDISTPVIQQPIMQKADTEIGDGCWLGQNACVIGAKIGRNCVVGANAVVTRNIPDYCVVVGAPAKIIKRFDLDQKVWRKTSDLGEFL